MKKAVSMIIILLMTAQLCMVPLFAGGEVPPPAEPGPQGEQQEPELLPPAETPEDAPEAETPEAPPADEAPPLPQGEQAPAEPQAALAPQAGEEALTATVLGMQPENGAVNIPYNGKVRILFGQAMNTRAASAMVELHATIDGEPVVKPATAKTWEPDGKTCVASYENLGFATQWAVVIRGFYAHGEAGSFIEIPETTVGRFTTIPKPSLALAAQPQTLPTAGGQVALTATLTDIVAGIDYPLEWTATGGSLAKAETSAAPYTNTLTVPAGHKSDILVTVKLAGQSEVLETVLLGTGKTAVTIAGLSPTGAPYNGAAQAGYTGQPVFRQGESDITASVKNPALTALYTGRGGTLYGPSATPPANAGLYSVRLGLYGDDSYTATTTLDFSIEKIEQTLPALTRAFTYGQRLKDNSFYDANTAHNGYFQWLEPEAPVGDATVEDEERTAYASFRPNSPNYKTIERMAISIMVSRAPVWSYAEDVVLTPKSYDGTTAVGATTSFGGLKGSDVLTAEDYTATAHFNSPNVAEANTVTVILRLKETHNTRNYYLRSIYYDGPETDFDEPVDHYGYYDKFVLSGQSMEKGTMTAEDFSYTLADGYYNGSPQGPKVEVKRSRTGYGPVEIWTTGGGYDAATPPTNAGSYTLRAEVAEGPNYKACTVPLGGYTIAQASIQDLAPRINGPARVGSALQATLPVAAGNAFEWEWHRDGTLVPGASADTYQPLPEDLGHSLTARAITGNGNYGGQSAVSPAVMVLPALPAQTYGFVQPAPIPFVKDGKATVELVAGHAGAGLELVEYKSGNTRVFTVEKKPAGAGPVEICLTGVGTATLTGVWEKDGARYTSKAEVRVASTAELNFKLNPQNTAASPLKLNAGATRQIKASYQTAGIAVASLGWQSSNPRVAAVDANGLVTGVAPGTATITATATDILGRAFERSCAVQVPRPTTSLKLVAVGYNALDEVPRLVLAKYAGERNHGTLQLAVEASPLDATDPVKWSSSNAKIATVGNGATSGASITLAKNATVTVTTKNKAGAFTITAQAGDQKVSYKFRSVVPAEKIVLTNSGAPELNRLGQTTTIKAYAAAADGTKATDSGVTFISRDEGLATVTAKGVVTARSQGTVFIDIAAKDDPGVLYEDLFGKGVLFYLTIMPQSLKLNQESFTVAHSADPENPVVLPITATLNGGEHVTIKYAGVKYSIPNTKAFEFTGPEYEGSSYYKPNMAEGAPDKPVYIKLKTLPPNTSITTRITAYSAVYEHIKTYLDVTVTSKGVTHVSQLGWSNRDDAPGTTGETQLVVGASYTPAVQLSGAGGAEPGNRNMNWEISATGKKQVAWQYYVTFNAATGKVKATRASIDNAVKITVTGTPADPGAAAGIQPVSYSFMVRQGATGVKLALDGPASKASLPTGGTTSLRATVAPANTTNATVAWTANKPELVRFSSPTTSGEPIIVTGLKAGKVVVTATAQDGSGKKADFTLTITQAVQDIVITTQPQAEGGEYGTRELQTGKTLKLAHQLNAETTRGQSPIKKLYAAPVDKAVRWVVLEEFAASDPNNPAAPGSIVQLNAKKGQVKGLADGWALVRVVPAAEGDDYACADVYRETKSGKKLVQGSYANTLWVRVISRPAKLRLLQGNFSVHSPVGAPASFTLGAETSPLPGALTQADRTLTWTISDTRVIDFSPDIPAAEIKREGNTAVYTDTTGARQPGFVGCEVASGKLSATVTVKTTTKKSARLKVTLQADADKARPVSALAVAKPAHWVAKGKSVTPKVSFDPKTPGNKNLCWTIEQAWDNTGALLPAGQAHSIATVDPRTGKVTARGYGKVLVSAVSMQDSSKAIQIEVHCTAKA